MNDKFDIEANQDGVSAEADGGAAAPEAAKDAAASEKKTKREEKREEKETKKEEKKLSAEIKRLELENKELTEKADELGDRYARMLAEYDNFRKRAQKERDGIYADATADVLGEILPIKDSLELAMKYSDGDKLSQGVTMTLNKFTEILSKLGVSEFGAEGDSFDPNIHNAVFHIEDESLGEGVIAEVLMKGYKIGEKIIRYAMVKVAN